MSTSQADGLSPFGHPKGKMLPDGSWQRSSNGARVSLKLPISAALADAAELYTVPENTRLLIERVFYEVTTAFSGGTSSAIGISSDQAGANTKGDIHGNTGGDVAADLALGFQKGDTGAKLASGGVVVLEGGAKIRFDRITSAFTAGAGFIHVLAQVVG